jgi:drug/metabolite transporter (DMT)-like permease
VGNSLFGYAAWGWLLARYSAATITPMALLVPLFGMGSSGPVVGRSLAAVEANGRRPGAERFGAQFAVAMVDAAPFV